MNILKKTLSVIAAAMLMVGAAGTITAHANLTVPPYLPVTSISEVQGTVPDLKIAKNYGTVYPERVKKLLADNGWNHPSEHPDLLYIRGTDLYKECKD